jgi:FAD/FMN-containing dehydrogenase
MSEFHVTASQVSDLGSTHRGRVILPDSPGYDEARTVFAGDVDRRPGLIARPLDAADVAEVVAFAHGTGLPLAVRSGGHSGPGFGTTDGGIVIDVRDMRGLEIDLERRTAWAGTGLTAGEYTTRVGEHGLATGFGDTGSVGLGGITLGGGVGYLIRTHGLTIDNVIAAEVVTASGDILRVDASSHPELFWALRGGGGNFGVVTRFQYRLHPVDRVVGGMLLLPATADVIAGTIEAADEAPEELSVIANVMPAPPMPFVPASQHGQLVVMILACFAGEEAAGADAVAPFRALAQPIVDMVRPMRYPELFPPEDPSYRPKAIARTMFLRRVDPATADTILDYLGSSDAPMRVAQLRVLGGAAGRVASDATAYAHRGSRIMAVLAAFHDGPVNKAAREDWVARFGRALDQGDPGAYVNFLGNEGEGRIRAAYPGATWNRLAAVKARYDPDNLFRLNQNIPPAP